MKLVNELKVSLNGYFQWDKRRVDCFVKMLLALLLVQTVNLKKLACALFGSAQVDSHYRRLQRFLSGFRLDYNALARMIVALFKFDQGQHYLILDRTNWQWGQSDINILFLCIAYKKIAIPIFWLVLNKKGNSSTRERCVLIERFIDVFGKASIGGVLGDREFIGKEWFSYLNKHGLAFYFRIKKDADTVNTKGKSIAVSWLFHGLKLYDLKVIETARPIYGHQVFISGMRIEDDYLIVVTNRSPENAVEIYALRWEIETLFGCLKSKGFHFEDTHITNRDRIKKLIALLTVAFCWAHLTGEWRHEHERTIRLKKHGRPQYNLFRYGLEWITRALIERGQALRRLLRVFLACFSPMMRLKPSRYLV